jgi:hypothetical protein
MTLPIRLIRLLPRPHRRAYAERRAQELTALAGALEKSGMGGRTSPSASDVRAQADAWTREAGR